VGATLAQASECCCRNQLQQSVFAEMCRQSLGHPSVDRHIFLTQTPCRSVAQRKTLLPVDIRLCHSVEHIMMAPGPSWQCVTGSLACKGAAQRCQCGCTWVPAAMPLSGDEVQALHDVGLDAGTWTLLTGTHGEDTISQHLVACCRNHALSKTTI
jgi:hypothetical protein